MNAREEFVDASIFAASVSTNGPQGGDAGHGSFFEVAFEDVAERARPRRELAEHVRTLRVRDVRAAGARDSESVGVREGAGRRRAVAMSANTCKRDGTSPNGGDPMTVTDADVFEVLVRVVRDDGGLTEADELALTHADPSALVAILRSLLIEEWAAGHRVGREEALAGWAAVLEPCWGAGATTLTEADAQLLPSERRDVVRALRAASGEV